MALPTPQDPSPIKPGSSGASPFASRVQKPDAAPAPVAPPPAQKVAPAPAAASSKLVLFVSLGAVFVALAAVAVAFMVLRTGRTASTESAAGQTAANDGPGGTASAPSGSGRASLINNDMSQGAATCTGWDELLVDSGAVTAARDTNNFHSAPASLNLASPSGSGEGQVGQTVKLAGRQSLTVAGWVMSSGTARVTFGVQFFDAQKRPMPFSEILFTDRPLRWTRSSMKIEPPAQAATYSVVLHIAGAGQAWLDDVTVD